MIARAMAGLGWLAVGLGLLAGPAAAASPNHITVWVPDFFGGRVYVDRIDNTVAPPGFSQSIINVKGRGCNPNSVVIRNTDLYVVCNGDFGGANQILVYNTGTLTFEKKIGGLGTDGQQYFSPGGADASLIGSVFDRRGNLWVSAYNTRELLRISSAHLAAKSPRIDRVVIDSPDLPAGLALDSDGSLWVVGQFAGGIAVNFTDAVINQPGSFLGANPFNPAPRYCISNAAPGCQQIAGLFNNPEGVAVFRGSVWVSNNGGDAPAATLVRLLKHPATLTLSSSAFGGTVGQPFSCPGGMFAAGVPGAPPNTLWVNDEGYGVAGTDCGSSPADQGDQIGRVLEFLPSDLIQHRGSPTPEQFTGWTRIGTSSPGFGGIFVQMD
jgi:hypothetical protein